MREIKKLNKEEILDYWLDGADRNDIKDKFGIGSKRAQKYVNDFKSHPAYLKEHNNSIKNKGRKKPTFNRGNPESRIKELYLKGERVDDIAKTLHIGMERVTKVTKVLGKNSSYYARHRDGLKSHIKHEKRVEKVEKVREEKHKEKEIENHIKFEAIKDMWRNGSSNKTISKELKINHNFTQKVIDYLKKYTGLEEEHKRNVIHRGGRPKKKIAEYEVGDIEEQWFFGRKGVKNINFTSYCAISLSREITDFYNVDDKSDVHSTNFLTKGINTLNDLDEFHILLDKLTMEGYAPDIVEMYCADYSNRTKMSLDEFDTIMGYQ